MSPDLKRYLPLLVDDGINSNGGLSGLTITNDQLSLSTSNRYQTINSLDTSQHRLLDWLTRDDTRGLQTNSLPLRVSKGTLEIMCQFNADSSKSNANDNVCSTSCHIIILTSPSMGFPKASTTRPRSSIPTGTSTIAPVLLTTSPSRISLSLPNTTTPTLSGSKLRAIPCGGESESYSVIYYMMGQWVCRIFKANQTLRKTGDLTWEYLLNDHLQLGLLLGSLIF